MEMDDSNCRLTTEPAPIQVEIFTAIWEATKPDIGRQMFFLFVCFLLFFCFNRNSWKKVGNKHDWLTGIEQQNHRWQKLEPQVGRLWWQLWSMELPLKNSQVDFPRIPPSLITRKWNMKANEHLKVDEDHVLTRSRRRDMFSFWRRQGFSSCRDASHKDAIRLGCFEIFDDERRQITRHFNVLHSTYRIHKQWPTLKNTKPWT